MNFEIPDIDNIPHEIKDRYDTLTDDLKEIFKKFLDPDWEHTPGQAMEEVDAMIKVNNLPDNYKEIAVNYLRPFPGYSPKRALEEIIALQEIDNLPKELKKELGEIYLFGINASKPTEILEKLKQKQLKN